MEVEVEASEKIRQSITNASAEVDLLLEEVESYVDDVGKEYDWESVEAEVEIAKGCLCLERAEENYEAWSDLSQKRYLRGGLERERRSAREIRTDQLITDIWRVRINELEAAKEKGVKLREGGKLEKPIHSVSERLRKAKEFIESLSSWPSLWCLDGSSLRGNFAPDSDVDVLALFPMDAEQLAIEEEIEKRQNSDIGLIDGAIDFHPFFESSVVFQEDPSLLERLRRDIKENAKKMESLS